MAIKKILIANRGEIALRVISTCKEMGIQTVTVYAENDQDLPHACMSDESYNLGSGPLADNYLNKQLIIDIAENSGADAIHPGYGFLSENSDFCKMVIDAGITFIGPTPESIKLMGDKKASKEVIEKAGLPVIPGYHGDDQSPELLLREALNIGLPALIKASAGGGGKGMRIVNDETDFLESLESAKREAQKAFGNNTVLIEKYINNPRHIEVQVFGDQHGNYLHFYERECSIQRRHQKIIEESPSPGIDRKQREKITKTALQVARTINYQGAGTVEFIADEHDNYYFLEMNTRLQVEHPVTEMVTGYDMVRLQIETANGRAFTIKQNDIKQRGHSIEVRIYAEDPDNDFLPTIGTIAYVGSPSLNNIRLDSGYKEQNVVTVNYDPMLAKLIVWGKNREEAIRKAAISLDDVLFQGVKTNRSYLKRIITSQAFNKGKTFTSFVDDYKDKLMAEEFSDKEMAMLIGSYLLTEKNTGNSSILSGQLNDNDSLNSCWDRLTGFRNV